MQISEYRLRQIIKEEIGAANLKVGDKVKIIPRGIQWYEKLVPPGEEHSKKTEQWKKALNAKQGQVGAIDKIGKGQGIYKSVDVLYPDGDILQVSLAMLEKG